MVLFRALAAISMVVFVSLGAAGCSSGLSKEDADARCDQDKAALASNYNDAAYKQCEACYMECGDDCVRSSGAGVISYACADTSGSGGGSTSTGSTTSSQ